MLVCKRSSDRPAREAAPAPEAPRRKPGEAGPVFVPRRKPSALAEALLAGGGERVTAYDEKWFAGKPTT